MSFDINSVSGFDAQMAHIGFGGFLTLLLANHIPLVGASFAVIGFAAIKESIESEWGVWEPKQPWLSGLVDFGFFGIGIGAAVAVRLLWR